MPIFMDLHEVPGVTAKDAAEAHLLDVEVQDEYNCNVMTVWLDILRGEGFCLIEAPDKKAVELMHKNSHGLVPNKIIEVDSNMVKLFLGRISDPETVQSSGEFEKLISQSPYRTIIRIELKNPFFINVNGENGKTEKIKETYDNVIHRAIENHNGQEVKHITDGYIAVFTSVSDSVKCAIDIQDKFKIHNEKSTLQKILFAIAVHTGAPVAETEDFFGDTIQLTKRMCDVSRNGQIIFSSSIRNIFREEELAIKRNNAVKILSPVEEEFLNRLMELTELIWNDEGFNIDRFSKKIGFSKAQLYRKVTSLTGYSPNVFFRNYRLKRAINLIEKMKGNISEIAFESGFNNPSYFSKCFYKKFGILPSEYANAVM
jgi:AraC-like DNA-binding protein